MRGGSPGFVYHLPKIWTSARTSRTQTRGASASETTSAYMRCGVCRGREEQWPERIAQETKRLRQAGKEEESYCGAPLPIQVSQVAFCGAGRLGGCAIIAPPAAGVYMPAAPTMVSFDEVGVEVLMSCFEVMFV